MQQTTSFIRTSMLKYSVVIPLYNKENYIRETITSLALQRKNPDELILVDDASSDRSLTVAKLAFLELQEAFATTSIKIIELSKNGGPGNARNVGLEKNIPLGRSRKFHQLLVVIEEARINTINN